MTSRNVGPRAWRWLRSAAVARASSGVRFRGRLDFTRGGRGATSVEYALMVSLIAVVIIGAVTLFGQNLIALFDVPASAL